MSRSLGETRQLTEEENGGAVPTPSRPPRREGTGDGSSIDEIFDRKLKPTRVSGTGTEPIASRLFDGSSTVSLDFSPGSARNVRSVVLLVGTGETAERVFPRMRESDERLFFFESWY